MQAYLHDFGWFCQLSAPLTSFWLRACVLDGISLNIAGYSIGWSGNSQCSVLIQWKTHIPFYTAQATMTTLPAEAGTVWAPVLRVLHVSLGNKVARDPR